MDAKRWLIQLASTVIIVVGALSLSRSAGATVICEENCEAVANCDSGGPGATTCNQSYSTPAPPNPSSCSVTCGTGYYACCGKKIFDNTAGCPCRLNGT